MLLYEAFNTEVFNAIPAETLKILDVGCGSGALGKALKDINKDRIIYGLTYSPEEQSVAEKHLDKVFLFDINNKIPTFDELFDCIIFSHILEHTYQPEKVLAHFKNFLKPAGVVVVALPNVLYYKQRFKFLSGHFKYSNHGGLMDITHFRFFDWQTAQQLLQNSGFEVTEKKATGNVPLGPIRRIFTALSRKMDSYFLQTYPGLFGFQFVIVAKAKYPIAIK